MPTQKKEDVIKRPPLLTIENARIAFRNFAGRALKYNREGDRNFVVLLTEELATALIEDEWNVKRLRPREDDEEPQPYLKVKVAYKADTGAGPNVFLVLGQNQFVPLDGETVGMLDTATIEQIDLNINPYVWGPINGKFGITAYLRDAYVTISRDPLTEKYRMPSAQEADDYEDDDPVFDPD